MNKKLLCVILAGVLLFSMTITALAANQIFIDLEEVSIDTPPVLVADRMMVPARAIAEKIGYTVKWIGETKTVEIYAKDAATPSIIMQVDNKTAYYTKFVAEINEYVGVEAVLDVPPMIIDDRTLVPLRFMSEAVNYTVDYNVDDSNVYLFSPGYTESHIGEGIGGDGSQGEGIGEVVAITENEQLYVLSFKTKSWLNLKESQKQNVISLMARWWEEVDGYIVADFDAVLQDLDFQMNTYSKNGVDASLFETACEIYGLNVTNYVKG